MFYQDLLANPAETNNERVLNGGTYDCDGNTVSFDGLKYVVAYYFHEEYIRQSKVNDTFSGFVEKQLADSSFLNNGDEKNEQVWSERTALKYWNDLRDFLNAEHENFPYWKCETSRQKRIIKYNTL